VPEGPGRTCHWLATVQRCVEPPTLGGSTILVASVGGPALVMLRARRHLLEGVGGVVHDNERPRLCLAVVIVDKIEGVASAFMFGDVSRRAVAPKIVVGSVSMMADAASMTASCRLSNLAFVDGYLGGADQITKPDDRLVGNAVEAKILARR
jgi:hypothetical protein